MPTTAFAALLPAASRRTFHPEFVEALEKRPCCPVPGLPVLYGHPLVHSADWKPSSGTVALAEQIGIKYPRASNDVMKDRGENRPRRDYCPLVWPASPAPIDPHRMPCSKPI